MFFIVINFRYASPIHRHEISLNLKRSVYQYLRTFNYNGGPNIKDTITNVVERTDLRIVRPLNYGDWYTETCISNMTQKLYRY